MLIYVLKLSKQHSWCFGVRNKRSGVGCLYSGLAATCYSETDAPSGGQRSYCLSVCFVTHAATAGTTTHSGYKHSVFRLQPGAAVGAESVRAEVRQLQ